MVMVMVVMVKNNRSKARTPKASNRSVFGITVRERTPNVEQSEPMGIPQVSHRSFGIRNYYRGTPNVERSKSFI
jgi:hypothetical protein